MCREYGESIGVLVHFLDENGSKDVSFYCLFYEMTLGRGERGPKNGYWVLSRKSLTELPQRYME